MKLKSKIAALFSAAAILIAPAAKADTILFGFVDTYQYYSNGQGLAQYLTNAGHTVVQVDMATTAVGDLSVYDQIWVYDLVGPYGALNNNPNQMAYYQAIADWYLAQSQTADLIVDGRIISSNYVGRYEEAWIQGYADALSANGGLVLGTDHDYFVEGINNINALIGIDPFTGNFYQSPFQATVDQTSPLYDPAATFLCSDGSGQCIWDHSSTSYVPTGDFTLTNGDMITLSPVAFHGHTSNAWDNAAVASTLGSIIFGTCGGPGQPPCIDTVPGPAPVGLLGLGLLGLGWLRRRTA